MNAVRGVVNVAFFLIPKRSVVWISTEVSMRHAFLRMEESGFTAIPIVDRLGSYAGTVTEGDILRKLMYRMPDVSTAGTERVCIMDVTLRAKLAPVNIEADIKELFERAIDQSFVPVQDSRGVFIGIVRRREILEHCLRGEPTAQ